MAKPQYAGDAPLMHDDIVQRHRLRLLYALLILDGSGEGETGFDGEGAPRRRIQHPVEVLGLCRGEEPDSAHVDPDDRCRRPVHQAGAAQQGSVSTEGEQTIERLPEGDDQRPGVGPIFEQALLSEEGEAQARCGRAKLREQAPEIVVAGVAHDPDVHRGARLSSAARARMRPAMPAPVSPTSASCRARGACS